MLVSLTGRCAPGMRYVPLRRGITREASQACSKERWGGGDDDLGGKRGVGYRRLSWRDGFES